MKRTRRASLWLAGAAIVGACAFLIAVMTGPHSQAQTVPGTVEQSSSAEAHGFKVTAERAVFSAAAVDVWIHVESLSQDPRPLTIVPSDAVLGSQPASSVLVGKGGSAVLRFPALDAVGSQRAAPLVVSAISASATDNLVRDRVVGSWEMSLQLPTGDAADAATSLEALQPAVAVLGGTNVLFEAFRTTAATIVRYEQPTSMLTFRPPTLEVGSRAFEATRSEQQGTHRVLWFEATDPGAPMSLTFADIYEPGAGQSTFTISIDAFTAPSPSETETIEIPLQWQSTQPGGPPAIDALIWRRDALGTTLRILVPGIWDPGPTSRPRMIGDGAELRIAGAGTYPPHGTRGAQSSVEAELPDGRVPRTLTVTLVGASAPSGPVRVTLHP